MIKYLQRLAESVKIKDVLAGATGFLTDPFLEQKITNLCLGAGLLLRLGEDNDVEDLCAGRLVISQVTINQVLNRALQAYPLLKVRVAINHGLLAWHIAYGKKPVEFTLKTGNLRIYLERNRRAIAGEILEFPSLACASRLKKIFYSAGVLVWRKTAGEERVYRRLAGYVPGLSVQGKTLLYELDRLPGLYELLSRDLLGIRAAELLQVTRVDLLDGEIHLYLGPRIPPRLISKSSPP